MLRPRLVFIHLRLSAGAWHRDQQGPARNVAARIFEFHGDSVSPSQMGIASFGTQQQGPVTGDLEIRLRGVGPWVRWIAAGHRDDPASGSGVARVAGRSINRHRNHFATGRPQRGRIRGQLREIGRGRIYDADHGRTLIGKLPVTDDQGHPAGLRRLGTERERGRHADRVIEGGLRTIAAPTEG